MFDELSNSIKATLYERAKKPFTGAFALSWCVINWKIIATIFFVGEKYLKDKTRIEYIQENYISWKDNLWMPLLVSFFIILILPSLNIFALSIKQVYKGIEFKILKKQPVAIKEYANLLEKLNKQEEELTLQLSSKTKEIETLQFDLSELKENLKIKSNDLLGSEYKLSELQKQLNESKRVNKSYKDQIVDIDKQINTIINELSSSDSMDMLKHKIQSLRRKKSSKLSLDEIVKKLDKEN